MKTLILDLDETLVFSSTEKRDNFDYTFKLENLDYYVSFRSGLKDFILYVEKNFNVIVWTSSDISYAQIVVDKIFNKKTKILDRKDNKIVRISSFYFDDHTAYPPLTKVLKSMRFWDIKHYMDGEDLTLYTKPIKKLKAYIDFDITQIICIDNDPYKFVESFGNYFYIKDFIGKEDKELKRMTKLLKFLKDLEDVRIKKQNHKELCFPK